MYIYSFTYFTIFFNKTNGQTCAKKSTVSNISKRREYIVTITNLYVTAIKSTEKSARAHWLMQLVFRHNVVGRPQPYADSCTNLHMI